MEYGYVCTVEGAEFCSRGPCRRSGVIYLKVLSDEN
jgi:hypothetical protein